MPNVKITIGQRDFDVACQDGEEDFLQTAAAMLDVEATALIGQTGRLPDGQMLLMSGLMLADKTAGLEDQLRALEEQLAQAGGAGAGAAREVKVEVPVVPPALRDSMAELADQAEALAEAMEERAKE